MKTRTATASPQFADYLARRLTYRALRRNPAADGHQIAAIGRELRNRIVTSPAYRRREAEEKAAREAAGRMQRQRLAEMRAAADVGSDRATVESKAELLQAVQSRREGVRMVIEFAGGGRWTLPAATGSEFKASQARLSREIGKTSDRVLFEGLAPKSSAGKPSARGWRALFAEFCRDSEFCNAMQAATDAGASIVFGCNQSVHGYRLPFAYELVEDVGDGFALVRQLYMGPHGSVGKFRVMSVPHGLTAGGEFKQRDDATAEFEALRARAIEAAARLIPTGQDVMRAEFLAAAVDQVQP